MLKSALLALPLSILVMDAQAQSIPGAVGATCGQVRSIINTNGAAIVRWQSPRDPRVRLHERFVASRAFCDSEQIVAITYIPTADAGACPVFECRESQTNRFTALNLARQNAPGFESKFGKDRFGRGDHDRGRGRDRDHGRGHDHGRDLDSDNGRDF